MLSFHKWPSNLRQLRAEKAHAHSKKGTKVLSLINVHDSDWNWGGGDARGDYLKKIERKKRTPGD